MSIVYRDIARASSSSPTVGLPLFCMVYLSLFQLSNYCVYFSFAACLSIKYHRAGPLETSVNLHANHTSDADSHTTLCPENGGDLIAGRRHPGAFEHVPSESTDGYGHYLAGKGS